MLRMVVAYISTGVVFVALDAGWLTLAGPRIYRPAIGPLLADKVALGPAVVFYLLFVFGLVYFCVGPAAQAGAWTRAAVAGLLLGLVSYGAYDLTNQATLKIWSMKLTVCDLAWGAFASAAASTAGVFATRAVG